jgi:hypothetical protein
MAQSTGPAKGNPAMWSSILPESTLANKRIDDGGVSTAIGHIAKLSNLHSVG